AARVRPGDRGRPARRHAHHGGQPAADGQRGRAHPAPRLQLLGRLRPGGQPAGRRPAVPLLPALPADAVRAHPAAAGPRRPAPAPPLPTRQRDLRRAARSTGGRLRRRDAARLTVLPRTIPLAMYETSLVAAYLVGRLGGWWGGDPLAALGTPRLVTVCAPPMLLLWIAARRRPESRAPRF